VRRALALLLAVGLAAACTRPSPGGGAADAQPAPDAAGTTSVSLERRPCFGACPVYTVHIDGSGAVRFEGRRFVTDTGTFGGTISKASVDSLVAELVADGYFGLADRYAAGQPGCGRYATDLPTVVTEVHLGGRAKRVEHDNGCAEVPEALGRLERRIDQVAGVAKWVER
jgi:hypothetical protein